MNRPLTAAMDNVLASTLGEAQRKADKDIRANAGDYIDAGLILLRHLNAAGFDVIVRPLSSSPEPVQRS